MPFIWLAAAFAAGVLLAARAPYSSNFWWVLGAFALAMAGLLRLLPGVFVHLDGLVRRLIGSLPPAALGLFVRLGSWVSRTRRRVPLWLLVLAFALGGVRYQLATPEFDAGFIAWYNDSLANFVVEGVVAAPPDVRDTSTYLRLEVSALQPENGPQIPPVEGNLLVVVYEPGAWAYGDLLRLEGRLETPPEGEGFSYRDYLARQGVYSTMRGPKVEVLAHEQGNPLLQVIYGLRQQALDMVYALWPDPEASLLAGILLGIESGIPPQVREAFVATGTSHIIAISGFNITIVAALFAAGFTRLLGPLRGAVAAAVGIAFYTIFVGGDPAVFRAAILGGLALFATQIGRRQAGLNSLALAALVMALLDPFVLWDVGFQLSFAATLGLVLYAEPLTAGFKLLASRRLPQARVQALSGPVSEYLLMTLAAQITTLPIILFYFQRLSLSAFVTNPLILPAQPPVMTLGGLAVILGLVFEPLGRLAAPLVWPFVVYTVRLVEAAADLFGPGLYLGALAPVLVIGFYIVLFGLTYLTSSQGLGPLRERVNAWLAARGGALRPLALAGLAVLVVLVWRGAFDAPDGRLHVTVLDVGNGEAVLVQSPTGRYVLVNGGDSPSRLSDGLGRRLPLFDRRLDYLVVAAPGEEQVGALADTLLRFSPGSVLWAGPTAGNAEARFLQRTLSERGLPVVSAESGQILALGDGAQLEVLAVGSRGAVLLLEYGNFRMLLPVGIDFELFEALGGHPRLQEPSALLLADSGYGPSNPPEWIAALQPQVLLLSVAPGDFQGRPDPALLEALEGYTLLRTDRNGWIELATDSEQLWVQVEK
jgi:competence protein ComEC